MITISGSSGKSLIVESIVTVYSGTIVLSVDYMAITTDYHTNGCGFIKKNILDVIKCESEQHGENGLEFFIVYWPYASVDEVKMAEEILSNIEIEREYRVRHYVFVHGLRGNI